MVPLLICFLCRNNLNNSTNKPKKLPCLNIICSSCSQNQQTSFLCICSEMHDKKMLSSLVTSSCISNLISNVESNINFDLNVFLNEIKTEIKNKKNVILNNLDYQMDCINNRKKQLIESVNTIRNNILISIHDKRTSALAKYEDISKHNIISNSSIIDQQQIIENSNYIQYFLTNLQIEHKLALNDEFSFDIGLIGKIVEPYQEKMLKKIVTLKRIDSTNNIKIEFNRINCDYRYHKSIAVLPLFKNKLVKFSFTKDDTICMDLIHSDGTLSKSVIFLEEMRTMPILSSYSSNVVICLRNYGANEFSNCIYLLNSKLDVVKKTNHSNSIDSIYMNFCLINCRD